MLECLAVKKLHYYKRPAVLFADVVDDADVRVVQGGGCPGLAAKPFERLGIAFDICRKELECDQAAKANVLSLIHHSHSAAADFLEDAIVRDGLTDQLGDTPSLAPMLGAKSAASQRVAGVLRVECVAPPIPTWVWRGHG